MMAPITVEKVSSVGIIVTSVMACVSLGSQLLFPRVDPRAARPQTPAVENVKESQVLDLRSAPAVGSTTAKVALIEFSDFQCPFCGKYEQNTYPSVIRDFVDT